MSSSFGKWYAEQQAEENGEGGSSSWFDIEQGLPLFSTEGMPGFSFESMRESMEASMPRKILGMGYQQRFQVRSCSYFLMKCRDSFVGEEFGNAKRTPMILISHSIFLSFPGLLRSSFSIYTVFCIGILCRLADHRAETAKVCSLLYMRFLDIYGLVWNSQGTGGTFEIDVYSGSNVLHHYLFWKYASDLVSYFHQRRDSGICECSCGLGSPTCCIDMVFDQLPARRGHGTDVGGKSYMCNAAAAAEGLLPSTIRVY